MILSPSNRGEQFAITRLLESTRVPYSRKRYVRSVVLSEECSDEFLHAAAVLGYEMGLVVQIR